MYQVDEKKEPQEVLEKIALDLALTAQNFFPPKETAENCMHGDEEYYGSVERYNYVLGVENGEHSRAVTEASFVYEKMYEAGYDPVELAENELQRTRDEGLDLDDVDWSWLYMSRLSSEYEELLENFDHPYEDE